MNLLGLLANGFLLPNDILADAQSIDRRIQEYFSYTNEYVIDNTSDNYLEEIHLQHEISASGNKTSLGFDNLEKQLANYQPEDVVSMRFIESPSWGGRAYFLLDNKAAIWRRGWYFEITLFAVYGGNSVQE